MEGRLCPVSAIDVFCGAGGLSYGLQQAGIPVVAGFDVDPNCRYPFEANIESPFIEADVQDVSADHLKSLWSGGAVKLLAGCAPCQPFSPYRRGLDTSHDDKWPLLDEFKRLIEETEPDIVTMENVPRISGTTVFRGFVNRLRNLGYQADWRSCYAPRFGMAQKRRRLVLLGSRLGSIRVPEGAVAEQDYSTVRDAIGDLPPLNAGAVDPDDNLHKSRTLSDINLQRIRASKPGGDWKQWPQRLRASCHRRDTGQSFGNVYARMAWDELSPTITTLAYSYGSGRFGHPEQDRAISLREAALLQGFPRDFEFAKPGSPLFLSRLGRLIGNAVPPPLAAAVGSTVVAHVRKSFEGGGAAG